MRLFKLVSTLLMAVILASCGGGNSDVPAKPKFTSQVSFGDSLSDVGSYKAVGGVVATLGGGQFTINIPGIPTNWTEMTAAQIGLSNSCAYEVGLNDGTGIPSTTYVAPTFNTSCTGYAQGGARVTNPVGIGNYLQTAGGFALTVPVVTQIANHLAAHGGSFTGNEIVFVMAGANDVFFQAGLVNAAAISPTTAVVNVQQAANELVAAVQNQILAKGAKYVVVVNVPDISSTPQVTSIANPATQAATKALFDSLVTAFNTTLKAGLPGSANVLNIDAFTASHDEVANPAKYNLTNVTGTACNLSLLANPLASSLACSAANLNTGVTASGHYLFADMVHPTPYGHSLFALYVLQAMTNKGWY